MRDAHRLDHGLSIQPDPPVGWPWIHLWLWPFRAAYPLKPFDPLAGDSLLAGGGFSPNLVDGPARLSCMATKQPARRRMPKMWIPAHRQCLWHMPRVRNARTSVKKEPGKRRRHAFPRQPRCIRDEETRVAISVASVCSVSRREQARERQVRDNKPPPPKPGCRPSQNQIFYQ